MKRCQHDNCPWLQAIQKFVDIDYVPQHLCDSLSKISTNFAPRHIKDYTGDIIRRSFDEFQAESKKYIDSIINKNVEIEEKIRNFVVKLYTEQDQQKRSQHMKGFNELINEMKSVTRALISSKQSQQKMTLVRLIENRDQIATLFVPGSDKKNRRRQREEEEESDSCNSNSVELFDWSEDTQPCIDLSLKTKFMLKITETDFATNCSHRNCVWKDIWKYLVENSNNYFDKAITGVPLAFCREIAAVSKKMNVIVEQS